MCSLEKTLPWGNHVALLHDPPLDRPWANLGALLARPQSCHGNEHHGIDPNMIKFRLSQLFCTGCLSLRSCQTAMLPHVGTPFQSALSQHPAPFVQNSIEQMLRLFYQVLSFGRLAKCNTTEPGLMKEGIGLGVRCIGLHGLVCHAVTFACWFGFKPWS